MRRSLATVGLAVLVLGLAEVAQAQDQRCSNPGLFGAWAYTETGSVIAPAPVGTLSAVAVGRYDFDAAGGFTGTQFSSTSGQGVGPDTKAGTYTIDDHCIGTLTLNAYRFGVLVRKSVWEVVVADNATEMHGIMTSLQAYSPLAGGFVSLQPVMTFHAKRLFRDRANQ